MSRKKVTVVGGGFVGSTTAQRIVDLELADVVLTDILDGPPAGKALDMLESGPITRTDARAAGISTATGDYSGFSAQAGDEPGRFAEGELRCGEGGCRADRQALAGLRHHRGDESAGRHGAGRVQGERLSEESCVGDGWGAGLGAHELVCGHGMQGQCGKRALVCARWAR